jgi:hypothetical protein
MNVARSQKNILRTQMKVEQKLTLSAKTICEAALKAPIN